MSNKAIPLLMRYDFYRPSTIPIFCIGNSYSVFQISQSVTVHSIKQCYPTLACGNKPKMMGTANELTKLAERES